MLKTGLNQPLMHETLEKLDKCEGIKEISAMHESKANSQIESMYEKRYNCILVQGYQKNNAKRASD